MEKQSGAVVREVDSSFNINRIRSDNSKYDLVVSTLNADVVTEVADVLLSPPKHDKYEHLKKAILSRLTDSADRQIHKHLNEVKLGDCKPSQLLRRLHGQLSLRAVVVYPCSVVFASFQAQK